MPASCGTVTVARRNKSQIVGKFAGTFPRGWRNHDLRNQRRGSNVYGFTPQVGWDSTKGTDSMRRFPLLLVLLLLAALSAAAQSHDDTERGTAGVYFDYTRLQSLP